MGHLEHTVDVVTNPKAGVHTIISYCSSLTSKQNSCTQTSDTKRVCHSRIKQNTTNHTIQQTIADNKVTWSHYLWPWHNIYHARGMRFGTSSVLRRAWPIRLRSWPSSWWTVHDKMSFFPIVVTLSSTTQIKTRISIMFSSIWKALHSTRLTYLTCWLGRKPPRPTRGRLGIGCLPSHLIVLWPRWSANSRRLLLLIIHFFLCLLHQSSSLH